MYVSKNQPYRRFYLLKYLRHIWNIPIWHINYAILWINMAENRTCLTIFSSKICHVGSQQNPRNSL
jgi:hypothetical protein